jgi:carbamoyl-phosphate synthase large subunit
VSDEDAALVSRARQLFPESRAFISGPLESVLIARSRNKTTELCRGLNIDIPKTLFVTHDDAIDAASELGFPCFLKLSDTVASHGVFEILNKAQLAQELASIPARTEMQLQAAVEGDFVDITGFALGGKVLESFAFRCDYIHSHGGTPAYTHRLNDERLSHILSKIAAQLGWTGGLDLDLLRRKDGSLALLEINPRFSGTAVFPFKLGMDFPMYFVNAHLGINQTPLRRDGRPNAERFVSLIEETSYLSGAGGAGQKQANDFRADNKWVDSAFWDDKGYSAALFNHVRRILLKPKRALRQTNSTIR